MIARLLLALVTISTLPDALVAVAHAATCTDDVALAAARAAADDACPCAGASDGRTHVQCVVAVTKARVAGGLLPKACAASVKRCAKSSSCGRPDRAPCCITSPLGRTTCKVTTPERCAARGGCTGALPSCCDACGPAGCVTTTSSSTSTTIASTTTSTTVPAVCGDGRIEGREQCDGEVFCDPASCFIPLRRCCQIPTDTGVCSMDAEPTIPCAAFGETATTVWGVPRTGANTCSGFPLSQFFTDGPCGAVTSFETVPLCCDVQRLGLGCTQSTASDTQELVEFQAACSELVRGQLVPWASVGTCGPDGHCIPAH